LVRNAKHLELLLEKVPEFMNPSKELEQYTTPSRIAAHMLWTAYMKEKISGKIVIDLGCGTGKLAYGAMLLNASSVYCVDIDKDALNIAKEFISERINELGLRGVVDFLLADIRSGIPLRPPENCTIVMNPPFGIWSKGADMEFLKESLKMCRNIFSIHKASEGLLKKMNELKSLAPSLSYRVLFQDLMGLRMSMPHHRKRIHYIKVMVVMLNNYSTPY